MRKSVLTGATRVLGAAMLGAVGVGVAGCGSNSQNSQVIDPAQRAPRPVVSAVKE
jgi:hypothetical protein